MPVIVTSNTVFEPVPLWAKVPHGIWLREATSVAVDSDDNVFVLTEDPVIDEALRT